MVYKIRTSRPYFAFTVIFAGSGVGCSRDCATGFSRDDEGVCHADVLCPAGYERKENLACHPMVGQDEADSGPVLDAIDTGFSAATDTGVSAATDTGEEWPFDGDLYESGAGRIAVRYAGLENLQLYGFVVTGQLADQALPNAAFCQVILELSVDILGYLAPYDGESPPCPMEGDPFVFDPGTVTLNMLVAGGESDDPVLCDERIVEVDGDTMVDFGDVTSCSP